MLEMKLKHQTQPSKSFLEMLGLGTSLWKLIWLLHVTKSEDFSSSAGHWRLMNKSSGLLIRFTLVSTSLTSHQPSPPTTATATFLDSGWFQHHWRASERKWSPFGVNLTHQCQCSLSKSGSWKLRNASPCVLQSVHRCSHAEPHGK